MDLNSRCELNMVVAAAPDFSGCSFCVSRSRLVCCCSDLGCGSNKPS